MAAQSQDKIFFGAALLLLLASAGWMALQTSKLSKLRASSDVTITATEYEPAGIDAPTVATKTWPAPVAQTGGPLWVYDVFTPPEIYYDANTRRFTVSPPVAPPLIVETPKEIPFGVELVQIKSDSFRLQLVGYIGSKGDERGTFENALTGETIIGRGGKKIPELGLTIKSFEVKQVTTVSEESMPIIVTEATAIIVDDKTGEEIPLTNMRRRIKGDPIAVLRAEGSGQTFENKAGTQFKVGETTYTVVSLVAEPPSVEVRKEAPDLTEPVTKTLTPGAPVSPVPAPSEATEQQPAASSPFPFGT